jgi:hypothetical protein
MQSSDVRKLAIKMVGDYDPITPKDFAGMMNLYKKLFPYGVGDAETKEKILAMCANLNMLNTVNAQFCHFMEKVIDDKNKEIKALHMLIEVQDEGK